MATATPSPTPNPDAMKYSLDTTLAEMMNVASERGGSLEPVRRPACSPPVA